MYLVTSREMRAFDATAIEDYGIPGVVLMENAGRATFQILKTYLRRDLRGLRVSVIAGPGNNGGDGYVISRYLINHGAEVHTFLLSRRDKIRGDALINLEILERMNATIMHVKDLKIMQEAFRIWQASEVIVDAILGTGLASEVRSPFREAVTKINQCKALVVAVDVPSGLDSDSGRILGTAVKAHLTATYGFKKLGMAINRGPELCGRVEVVDISIPLPAVEQNPPWCELYEEPRVPAFAEIRSDPLAHKGRFGHVLVVGGSPGKTGAPAMAGMAAGRVGAGLVTVAVPASLNPILEAKLTEEMTEPLPESEPGFLGMESAERILALAEDKEAIVLGPGLSTHEGIPELVRTILARYHGWVVLDADGLNALGTGVRVLRDSPARTVLTPHPGEMARLIGNTTAYVQGDRMGEARKMAMENRLWVILKGAGTITASPSGRITINATGNPWMASGGQGDALSGILGGLLVQEVPPEEALPFGVYLHGLAADKIVERIGPAPVLATDVINEIPALLGACCTTVEDAAIVARRQSNKPG